VLGEEVSRGKGKEKEGRKEKGKEGIAG